MSANNPILEQVDHDVATTLNGQRRPLSTAQTRRYAWGIGSCGESCFLVSEVRVARHGYVTPPNE